MFNLYLQQYSGRIEDLLNDIICQFPQSSQHKLTKAIRYSLFSGGKRLRPLLVYGAGEIVQANIAKLDNIAVAVECIHTYSLIHDDLPAMDNDDFRRGKRSCHKQFDEATAILAGDALQALAFERLAQNQDTQQIFSLAKAIGAGGMVLGQFLDMQYKDTVLSQRKKKTINHLKTGALITVSVQLATLCAQITDQATLDALQVFSQYFGLAYQCRDDAVDENNARVQTWAKKKSAFYFQKAYQALANIKNIHDDSMLYALRKMLDTEI